jgi:hypothetical protein
VKVHNWRDRKHWEFSAFGYVICRWCEGAPCHLVASRHPVRAYRPRILPARKQTPP